MSNVSELFKQYKEYVVAAISVIGALFGAASWVYAHIATKEQLNLSFCLNDRNIKLLSANMEIKDLDQGISQINQDIANLETVYNGKTMPVQDMTRKQDLLDLKVRHLSELETQERVKKDQTNRNCIDEMAGKK